MEFAYNRSVHTIINHSPFEVMYGFNPLTPMDLLPLPLEKANLDGKQKADFVKALHERVQIQIQKKTLQYEKQHNKGRKQVVFEPGDWVWLHLRKERFPNQRKYTLMPRGDGPFRVSQKINDNAYKLELPGEYGNVSATFNVSDLSLFDAGDEDTDSRTNPFKERGNDMNKQVQNYVTLVSEYMALKYQYQTKDLRNLVSLDIDLEAATSNVDSISDEHFFIY